MVEQHSRPGCGGVGHWPLVLETSRMASRMASRVESRMAICKQDGAKSGYAGAGRMDPTKVCGS